MEWALLDREAVTQALREAPVAIPIGALEQHGSHLPTGTDFISATEVVARAARKAAKPVLTLPALPYGLSHYHAQFGATVTLRAETLSSALNEICEVRPALRREDALHRQRARREPGHLHDYRA